jgi:hypothetical protein
VILKVKTMDEYDGYQMRRNYDLPEVRRSYLEF